MIVTFSRSDTVQDVARIFTSCDAAHCLELYRKNPYDSTGFSYDTKAIKKLKATPMYKPLVTMAFSAYCFDVQACVQEEDSFPLDHFVSVNFAQFMEQAVSNKGYDGLRHWIRGVYLETLEATVEIAPELCDEIGDGDDVELQGLRSLVYNMAVYIPRRFIRETAIWFQEDIVEAVKKQFNLLLERYVPFYNSVCSWIHQTWDLIKQWVAQMMEKCDWFLGACKEVLVWGVAMLACCCALGVLEKVLIALGMMSESCDLVGLFLRTGIVASVCYQFRHKIVDGMQQMAQLVGIVSGAVAQLMVGTFFPSSRPSGQMSPLSFLEGLSESISNFCGTTLVSTGRACQAVNSIATCMTTVKGFAAKIFETLQHFVWKVLGFESRFLQDATMLFGSDIDGWLRAIARVQDAFAMRAYATQDDLLEMQVLIKKGREMRAILLNTPRANPMISSTVVKGLETVERLAREAALQGVRGVRKMPLVLFAYGESRTGKTLVTQKLMDDFLKHYELPSDSVYSRNMSDPFWSGYRRQACVLIDDFGAVVSEPSAESQLIHLVSSAPYSVNMASLEEKGMCFDSKYMFISSNLLEPTPESKIVDDSAFRNRRHVLFQVKLKEDVEYDSADFTRNQYYEVLKYTRIGQGTSRYKVEQTFDSYDELLAYALTTAQNHDAEQTANLSSGLSSAPPAICFGGVGDLLVLGKTFFSEHTAEERAFEAEKREKGEIVRLFTIPHNGGYTSVGLNHDNTTVVWPALSEECDAKNLAKSEKMLFRIYGFLRCSSEINMVLKNHLGDLICPDDYDATFKYVGDMTTPGYTQVIGREVNKLEQWQRAALSGMGSFLQRKRNVSWYTSVLESVKDNLYTMYSREISEWPQALKVVVGVVLVGVVGTGFWHFFGGLREAGNGTTFVGLAANMYTATSPVAFQSRKPNRFEVAQYTFQNARLRNKPWARAQSSLENSAIGIMNGCMATLSIGSNCVQIMMVPGRKFIGYAHFFQALTMPVRVKITMSKKEYFHHYDPKNMEYLPDNELCVYKSNSLQDVNHTILDLCCMDLEKEMPAKFPADFISCKRNKLSGEFEVTNAEVNVEFVKKTFSIETGDYVRQVGSFLRYEAPTVDGDCGSLLIATVGNKCKVVGIHVAGDSRYGYACPLPYIKPTVQTQNAHVYFDFYPAEAAVTDGAQLVGQLKEKVWIPLPTKTGLQETPVEWQLGTPCDKVPSVLSSQDPRLKEGGNEGYDPFSGGITKYKPMGELDPELLQEVATDMVETWFDCLDEDSDFGEVTLSEALNGIDGVTYMDRIPVSTSEGFPHILSRKHGEKGKGRFLQGDGEQLELIPGTSVEQAYLELKDTIAENVPSLVGIECPKDEKLPLRKVYSNPKTRCFTILPMEYNLLVRQRFLKFVRFIMTKRNVLPCQVGINPYSMEWGNLAARLQEKGNNVLCCDYSSFDGLITKQVMAIMARMINEFCGGSVYDKKVRTNLLMACCSRYAICKDKVWRVECGIPSGFPLTVICNSIFNEMLIRYSYKSLMRMNKTPGLHVESFEKMVALVTYGDDNLISVNDVIVPFFNGTAIKSFLAKYSVVITDGKDKTSEFLPFRKLEECDFLKRGFKQRTSVVWDSPEDKSSLWAQLHYVTTNNLERNVAYLVNLCNVVRELYMHSPDEAASLRRKALQNVSWLVGTDVPTLAQIREFYAYQRHQFSCDTGDSLDLMIQLEKMGPILSSNPATPELVITSDLRVLNLKNKMNHMSSKKDDEVWILFNAMYPASMLPDGVYNYLWTPGSGRGGLPTSHWVDVNIKRREAPIVKIVRTAFQQNKKVVFAMSGDVLPANVLAILVAARVGKLDKQQSNVALTSMMSVVRSLGFLTNECEFAFTV